MADSVSMAGTTKTSSVISGIRCGLGSIERRFSAALCQFKWRSRGAASRSVLPGYANSEKALAFGGIYRHDSTDHLLTAIGFSPGGHTSQDNNALARIIFPYERLHD